uniref:Uncharacterized protein n=1 Tax=Romanomermis culicivorax TaxID=13658 RepID=A0A915I267_ROMCU
MKGYEQSLDQVKAKCVRSLGARTAVIHTRKLLGSQIVESKKCYQSIQSLLYINMRLLAQFFIPRRLNRIISLLFCLVILCTFFYIAPPPPRFGKLLNIQNFKSIFNGDGTDEKFDVNGENYEKSSSKFGEMGVPVLMETDLGIIIDSGPVQLL